MKVTLETVEAAIAQQKMLILYFSSDTCGACKIIRDKVGSMLKAYPEIEICDIDGADKTAIAVHYQIFSYPILLLFVDGKETVRIGKNIDFLSFERTIARYYGMLY